MALDPAKVTHRELRATLLQAMLGAEETKAVLRAELAAERRERARERVALNARGARSKKRSLRE
ncbi:MAG: hypothetical protein ACTIJ6_10720 [Leucobacter sp.]